MSVWALGVCQSRNWEAFSVDLWGQGLPKAPLQNNSRPGSWQWDTSGCCCSAARPALKTHWLPPASLPLSSHVPSTGARLWSPEKLASGRKSRSSYHLADTICLECGNALLYVNRHVLWCQIQRRADGEGFLANSSSITTWEQVLNCWHGDTSHAWLILCMQIGHGSYVHDPLWWRFMTHMSTSCFTEKRLGKTGKRRRLKHTEDSWKKSCVNRRVLTAYWFDMWWVGLAAASHKRLFCANVADMMKHIVWPLTDE